MRELLDGILAHAEGRRWSARRLAERDVVEVRFDVGWTRWSAFAKVERGDVIVIRSLFPELVPEDRRGAVAEYLTRANWRLSVGNWEMDWSDGETRFKTSVDLNGSALDDLVLEALFDANTQGYRQFLRGLAAVREGRLSPEAAIVEVDV